MLDRENLINKLRVLRFQKFGSIRNAAVELGMTPQKLHTLERDRLKFLDVFLLNDLAHAYDMTLTELLEGNTHE